MKLVFDGQDAMAEWLGVKTGQRFHKPYTCIGMAKGGRLQGVALFNNYTGPSIEITVAGKGWQRGFFRAIAHYVFVQLKCRRLGATVRADGDVGKLLARLGFKEIGRPRAFYGDCDGIQYDLLSSECKW